MGIRDLINRHKDSNPKAAPAVKGMPPAGSKVPGVGDGRTTTNRKVKIDPHKPAHRKGK